MSRAWALGAALASALIGPGRAVLAYPLDGAQASGIRRLLGYQNAQDDPARGVRKLPPGALLGLDEVRLTLADQNPGWDLNAAPPDPALQGALESMLARRDPSYSIVIVDMSDPLKPGWAAINPDRTFVPQSVGKVLVMIGLFDALARAFPDPADRQRVLRETEITAGDWVVSDSHTIPLYQPDTGRNQFRPPQPGMRFRLSEWVDHMVSPSANAAGSTVWKEAMLLRHFGKDYPVSAEREAAFFKDTPKAELTALSLAVIDDPLRAAGIDLARARQGTFYTRGGQRHVPGTGSYLSPREAARILLRLEQGRMVDRWSSLEMKRYLYFTRKRYRYAYAPELDRSAVYFKSGSFYKCAPEEGYKCGKYRGNVQNVMNSVAIVESPARPTAEGPTGPAATPAATAAPGAPGAPAATAAPAAPAGPAGPQASAGSAGAQRRYLVAMMSDVLRVNSAWDHSRIAAAIDQAVRTRSAATIEMKGESRDIDAAGKGD